MLLDRCSQWSCTKCKLVSLQICEQKKRKRCRAVVVVSQPECVLLVYVCFGVCYRLVNAALFFFCCFVWAWMAAKAAFFLYYTSAVKGNGGYVGATVGNRVFFFPGCFDDTNSFLFRPFCSVPPFQLHFNYFPSSSSGRSLHIDTWSARRLSLLWVAFFFFFLPLFLVVIRYGAAAVPFLICFVLLHLFFFFCSATPLKKKKNSQ